MTERDVIRKLTHEIEAYQRKDEDLRGCHHYVFGVPLPPDATSFEYVVLGLNPGEQKRNWEEFPEPTKETIDFDWQDEIPTRSLSSIRWRRLCAELCGDRPLLMNDFFFWSTGTTGPEFERRFGHRFLDSPHFAFCRNLNLRLVDALQSLRAVVAPGLGHAAHFAALYGLRPTDKEPVRAPNGHRLTVEYERKGVPWIFTKHWTGAFGFSVEQRNQIRDYITAAGTRPR